MIKPKIYIRTDGNSEIGLGHVIRSLALAEMLKEDFDCIFATRFLTDYIQSEALKVCSDIVKLPESDEHFGVFLSILSGNEIVVLDNYFFDTDYQRAIKNKGCKLICIDDLHDKHFVADVVVNHAPYVFPSDYSVELYTKCLLGTKYALLRTPFLHLAKQPKEYGGVNNAFVCFGGSDYNNITQRVVERLLSFNCIDKIFVITGGAYTHKVELQILSDQSAGKILYYSNIEAELLAEIMYNSDFAVIPCSSILWECMAAKLPVVTGYYVDNQKQNSDYFFDKNIGCVVGDFNVNMFNEKDVLALSQTNIDVVANYIDGDSASRLKNEINELSMYKLRKATVDDAKLLFDWANDDEVRATAVVKKKIEWEEHVSWLIGKLKNSQTHIYILSGRNSENIGIVRFEKDIDTFVISYSIDKIHRKKGMGHLILQLGIKKMKEIVPQCKFRASVQQDNIASNKIFEKLKFKLEKTEIVKGYIFNIYYKDGNE